MASTTQVANSPFLLDHNQLTNMRRLSPTLHLAAWLRTPVRVTHCISSEQVAAAVDLADLRHPNIEFLLGTTIPPGSASIAAVTDAAANKSIASMLYTAPGSKLPTKLALNIALDVARGLMYLHVRNGSAHGCVSAQNVSYDSVKRRAVLGMLQRSSKVKASFQTDVQDLLVLLGIMLGGSSDLLQSVSPTLGNHLSSVLSNLDLGCKDVPSMNDVTLMLREALNVVA